LLEVAAAIGGALRAGTGTLTPPRAATESTSDAFSTDGELDVPLGVVALRTDAGSSELGARTIAHALAEQLSARELPVRAFFGEAAEGSSFAVVAVTGTEERLDALRTHARAALAAIAIPEGLAAEDAAAARSRALSLAAPEALARALAVDREVAPAADVARALLAAPVRLVLVRPTTAALRRAR
jgi:hypothetical protein